MKPWFRDHLKKFTSPLESRAREVLKRLFKRALLLGLIAVLVSAPNGVAPAQDADWRTSTPEEQGIDSSRLAAMFAEVGERGYNLHSLLIVRNGYLVTEGYAYPHDADTLHELRSATKSVTSTLVGIAIDQGYLTGVDQRAVDFFTQREIAALDEAKRAITLEHLLTMSSGLAWGQGMIEVPSFYEMTGSPDWLQFVLDRPLTGAPGERFVYNSGGSYLLSAILQTVTGQTTEGFAARYLFTPLGITGWQWWSSPQEITVGSTGLWLVPRDMAKFGYLHLNNGVWDGQPVVSAGWVETATQAHMPAGENWLSDDYGYHWWVDEQGYTMALGFGGQDIIVIPDRNMIVVTTGALAWGDFDAPERLLNDYILPASESSAPLPPNPDAVAALEAELAAWAHPTPQPVPPLPETAARISDRTIQLEPNSNGWDTVSISFEAGSSEAQATINEAAILSIGLDGVYRTSPDPQSGATMALKGSWADEQTFEVDVQFVGTPGTHLIRVAFDGDRVQLTLKDRSLDMAQTVSGTLLR